jgi:hypothetical protein
LLDLAERPFALAVAGGLLAGSNLVREKLQAWLQDWQMQCDMKVVNEPLEGCVRLAAPLFDGKLVKWHT